MRELTGYKKGINLGGWLSQCGADNYNDQHYSTFITEADIERIASWGLDHVRLPIDYNVIQNEDGSFIESGFGYIDNCIEWCRKYNLKIILDLHKAMGYVFDDATYCQFFEEEKLQDIFVSLWEEMARRYAKYHDFIILELLNEVTAAETALIWNRIADRTIKAIRAISKDVRIMIGGIFNGSIYGLTLLEKPADDNVVFTYHCYSPLAFTHQGAYWVDRLPRDFRLTYPGTVDDYRAISSKFFGNDFDEEYAYDGNMVDTEYFERLFSTVIEVSEKYNVPIYCGEYGVIDCADLPSTVNWYRDINAAFEKLGIPRAAWTYKSKDFGLIDDHYADVCQDIVKLL